MMDRPASVFSEPFLDSHPVEEKHSSPFALLQKYPRLVGLWAAIGIIGGVAWFSVATPEYVSEMRITPSEYSNSEVGTLSNKLGGLKKMLTGVGDASQSAMPLDVFKTVVQTQKVAEILVQNPLVKDTILKPYLDSTQSAWSKGAIVRGIKYNVLGMDRPASEEVKIVQDWIDKNLEVKDAEQFSVFVISAEYKDPEKAQALLKEIFQVSDQIVRERFQQAIDVQLNYLKDRLNGITNQDTRQPIFDMMTALERRRVTFSTTLPVSAMVLEEATLPQSPDNPKLPSTIIKACLVAGVLGFLHIRRRDKKERSALL